VKKVIAIDFDGTLCTDRYPLIGNPRWDVIQEAISEMNKGSDLILWTCREGILLEEALNKCSEWGLHFSAVNDSTEEWKSHYGNNPRKVGASEYWDDKAVNINIDRRFQ
jgi:hypothetical protein